LIVFVNGKARFFIRYLNGDNSLLHKYAVSTGDNVINPIEEGIIDIPTLAGTIDTRYSFNRWSNLPTNV
jgi:hypothetical protein